MARLCTVEPQRRHLVDFEAEYRECRCVRSHGHESRIDTSGHGHTRTRKRALSERVVLWMELEAHGVTNSRDDLTRVEFQTSCSNNDVVRRRCLG